MIELVFVIVVLGILAAVAVPKFAATRTDAQIAKGRADVASIRSAIITERQSRLIKGDSSYINKLHSSTTSYFDGNGTAGINLLMYGVTPEDANGHWKTGAACAGTPSVCTYTIILLCWTRYPSRLLIRKLMANLHAPLRTLHMAKCVNN